MSNYSTIYKKGDKVIVTNASLVSFNMIGTVLEAYDYCEQVIVRFNNWHDTMDEKQLTFSYNSVRLFKEDDTAKNGGNHSMSVTGNYRIAITNFLKGTNTTKGYAFALFDNSICCGDDVLVDTANGYNVTRVVDIIDKDVWDGAPVIKEVICKVDFSDYLKREEDRKKKSALKKKMDDLLKNNQELILYQAVADKNPEMAQMLAEYQKFGDV